MQDGTLTSQAEAEVRRRREQLFGARSWARPTFWLAVLLLFAAGVRFYNLNWDQSHHFHPDERAIAGAVTQLRLDWKEPQLNPNFFAYGSLPFYVIRALADVAARINPAFAGYDNIILIGRGLSAFLGVLTVLCLTELGARLYGPTVGMVAGFLLAAAPLHIQNSHYMTTDIALSFIILLALWAMIGIVRNGRRRDYILAGLATGGAVATKFSAMPLLAPLGVAVFLRLLHERRPLRTVSRALVAVVVAGGAFAIGEPYAFRTFHPVELGRAVSGALAAWPTLGPAVAWQRLTESMFYAPYAASIAEQSRMVRNAGLMPYTNQYIGTPKYFYEIEQMLWGMGPLLCLTVLWAGIKRVLTVLRDRSAEHLVLLAWVLPYFLVTGWFEVKFVRYLLPIYPIVILWGAAWLWDRAQHSRLGRATLWAVCGGTFSAAAALLSVYQRPHTVVTASEWVYSHIPPGKVILTQHWDEGFPFSLPNRPQNRYRIKELPYYEPDTPAKINALSRELANGDYIAFQTKRLYGAVTRAPVKYPLTNNYFYLLFAGELGYELIYHVYARPRLFGIDFPDELADESITVYDHPKVLIFENKERLNEKEIAQRIMRGRPSKKLTRNDLLLAEAGATGGLGRPETPPTRSSLPALLWFAAAVQLVGLGSHTIIRRWLPVPGSYALGKVLGVLVFAYVPWLLTSLGLTSFTRSTVAGGFVAILVCGLLARRGRQAKIAPGERWATELLFWGTFSFFALVRAYNPEVFWGEKPMDFSFLNALHRSLHLPPPEPWFAGSTLHYSYFGHFVVAALGKLCHLHPGLSFNLGVALFGGLTATAAFAAGCALSGSWRVGLLAALFTTLIGNLAGVREFIARGSLNFDYFWATSRVIRNTINEYPFWSFLFADLHAHVLVMPFSLTFVALSVWWARRGLADDTTRISAGMLPRVPLLALLGLTLGAIVTTNTWSTFTYAAFLPFLLGCVWLSRRHRLGGLLVVAILLVPLSWAGQAHPGLRLVAEWWHQPWVLHSRLGLAVSALTFFAPTVVIPTAAVGTLAGLFYLPYLRDMRAPERNWGFEHDAFAHFYDFATIFGLALLVAIPFLFSSWRRQLLPCGRERLPWQRAWLPCIVGLTVLACLLLTIPFSRLGEKALLLRFLHTGAFSEGDSDPPHLFAVVKSVRVGLILLAVLAFHISLQGKPVPLHRLVTVLFSFAFLVTAGVDLIHVWDRMNTVFKFYLDAWLIFGVAAAAAAPALWHHEIHSAVLRRIWQGTFLFLIAVGLFTATTATVGVLRTNRVSTPKPTLDGTAYLALKSPHEAAAFEWLNREVGGIPVIAEAYGPSYQEYARVSMNTGLPTILGWDYHVHQRAQPWSDINRRKDDIKKLYTSDRKEVVSSILQKYHVALVYVGPLEQRTYNSGNLANFNRWDDLLTRVYQNAGVTIFAVIGQFSGALPITAIEEVPSEREEGEVIVQAPPGEFRQPRGAAVDSKGNVYVADFDNHRIQKFDPNLEFLLAWGEPGILPGQFKQPCDVAVDPNDIVYVADTWNQRVQVFDTEGRYLREWSGGFFGPRGITVSADGKVYLADTGNHRIRRFNAEGVEELSWGTLGNAPGQFREPFGVITDPEGRVHVCDNGNGRVQTFDGNGNYLREFIVEGWRSEVFSEPKIARTPDGVLWVTVPSVRVIRGYTPEGKIVREITGREIPMGLFEKPLGIAYSSIMHELFVTDLENRVARIPLPVAAR